MASQAASGLRAVAWRPLVQTMLLVAQMGRSSSWDLRSLGWDARRLRLPCLPWSASRVFLRARWSRDLPGQSHARRERVTCRSVSVFVPVLPDFDFSCQQNWPCRESSAGLGFVLGFLS